MEASIICGEDDSIRCVTITGAGRFFCAGGDVGEFNATPEHLPFLMKELTAYLHMAITRFAQMPKPLITVINGPAAGAGLSLALLGDIALAARSAHLTPAYAAIGLSPDAGMSWMLPRLVGLRRAQKMVITNERVSADEAAAIGLVTEAVDDALLPSRGTEIENQLVTAATPALGKARNLLHSSFNTSLEAQMEIEARAMADVCRTSEARERIGAFVARRS